MIMEYGREETWGTYTAPVANRFITSHDVANGQVLGMYSDISYLKIE